jgi:hypothetical protein
MWSPSVQHPRRRSEAMRMLQCSNPIITSDMIQEKPDSIKMLTRNSPGKWEHGKFVWEGYLEYPNRN